MVGHIRRRQLFCHDFHFRVTPSNFELHVTGIRDIWLRYKVYHLIKDVIRDKTVQLTDEYALNSEVHLTFRFYNILINKIEIKISAPDDIVTVLANSMRMHQGVAVVALCVCVCRSIYLFVTTFSAILFIFMLQ